MKRKFKVTFDIEPKLGYIEKTYPSLNITPIYEDGKMTALQVDVEVILDDTANDEEIAKEMARELATKKITPLIERLRFLTGKKLEYMIKKMHQTSPPGGRWPQLDAKKAIIRVKGAETTSKSPMPEEDSLVKQDEDTTNQLMHFNRGMMAHDLAEKIREFFMVIESEEKANSLFIIPDDLRFTRIAVSHYKVKREKAKAYLKAKIGSDSIDFNNPHHVRFLRDKLPKFIAEARKLLDAKTQ